MSESKTLTQFEVDALLSAFNDEQAVAPEKPRPAFSTNTRLVKNYDFRRPDKFSKEQIRSLQLLYDNFARVLSNALSSYLRASVAIHLTSVEQISYGEYSEQLPKPTALFLMGLDPLPGSAVLEFNLPSAFIIIDRLLGGPGEAASFRATGELSEIETILLQTLSTHFVAALRDAWTDILPIRPEVRDIAFSSELVQAALPNEICVLVILELKILNSSGTMSFCMPYTLLEPIASRLSAQALVAGTFKTPRKEDPQAQQRTLHKLEKVTLPVSVHLGTASVSIQDVLHLEPGDIICLDSSANGTLNLLVDGRPRCRVRPGMSGSRLAVRVEEVIPPDPVVAGDALLNQWNALLSQEATEGAHEQPAETR
jgi:flagellar motor switch protein FliM